jgi:hypothetical protein
MDTTSFPHRKLSKISKVRTDFARAAVVAAFGARALHHLSNPGFVDREPDGEQHDDSEAIAGRQVVLRWLALATKLEGDDAETAYATADELRQVLRLSWSDVVGRAAA